MEKLNEWTEKELLLPFCVLESHGGSEHARLNLFQKIISNHLIIKRGDCVYIKPNLTVPWYVPGACTSKMVLESLCAVLKDFGCEINICEGDGGAASYCAHAAFSGNGLLEMERRYGVKFVSLSKLSRERVVQYVNKKEISFELPVVLVKRDFNFFINLPVLKVHLYTLASLAMKNLWGCIPDPFRIHYHYLLHHGIVALWKTIRPDLSIIDGTIAGDGNGPINGTPVSMNLILAGSADASVDRVATKILDVPFQMVKHLVLAEQEGLIRPWDELQLSEPVKAFCTRTFKAERRLGNWGMILMSQSPFIQKIVYHSKASKMIYKVLRKVRKNNIQNDLRLRHYGDPGWGKDADDPISIPL